MWQCIIINYIGMIPAANLSGIMFCSRQSLIVIVVNCCTESSKKCVNTTNYYE